MWALEAVDRTLPAPENVAKRLWDLGPRPGKQALDRASIVNDHPMCSAVAFRRRWTQFEPNGCLCCVGVTYYLHTTVLDENRIVVAIRAKAGEPEGNVGHLGVQLRAFPPL